MDRLAVGIASVIPGCSRLPTRHPLKVSLVMGLCGYLAGAVETLPFAWSTFPNQRSITDWVWLVRSIASACCVIGPFAIWSGYSAWRIVVVTLMSFVLLCGVFYLSENIGIAKVRAYPAVNAPEATVNLLYAFAICAGFLLAITVVETRPSRAAWIARFLVGCSIAFSLFLSEFIGIFTYTRIFGDLYYMRRSYGHNISALSMLALQLALGPIGLALLLGISLWDSTPSPRFEPADPAAMEAAGS